MATYSSIRYNHYSDSGLSGAHRHIKTIDASGTTVSFVDGSASVVFDNTYKSYLFILDCIRPGQDAAGLKFQVNAVGESGYNETLGASVGMEQGHDEQVGNNISDEMSGQVTNNSTTGIYMSNAVGNDADQGFSAFIRIYNPSSTTFSKQMLGTSIASDHSDFMRHEKWGWFWDVTAAINDIRFSRENSGTFTSGKISMYGIL